MTTVTTPLLGPPNQRSTGTGDRRFVNVLYDVVTSAITKEAEVYCLKRPGFANHTQPPAGNATGRGIYAWGANGNIYSVFDNKIYSDTTDLGVTLAASSGRVWFVETPETASAQLLIVSDGTDNYNIQTNDTITQIDENDDAQYPTSNLGPIDYLDGFLFQAQSDGQIWNTDPVNDFDSWTASGVLTAGFHGDALEATLLIGDQLFAFGKKTIETFFNNGNPSGSPLLRIDQNVIEIGLASKNSLSRYKGFACFVGESGGGRQVWMIGKGVLKDISDAALNRFLAAEGTSISSCTAWMEMVAGQIVYVLNLSSANRTFVYSVTNDMWCEWEIAAGGAKFNGIAATSLDGTTYVQDASNGRVYTFSPTTFQDSGSNFTVTMQPTKKDHGTLNRKFVSSLDIIGDTTTGSMSVSYSDNDFSSFSTAVTVDMSLPLKRVHRLGSYRERAYKLTYTQNAAMRVQAIREQFEVAAA